MTSATSTRFLRGLNYLLIILILLLGGALSVLTAQAKLSQLQQISGIGLLSVLVLGWFLIQNILSRWLLTALGRIALERTGLSNDGTFDLLYDNSPVAHLTLDQAGRIIDYNPKAVQLLKTDIDTLRGRSLFALCAPEYDSSIIASKVRAGLTITEAELPLTTSAGATAWVLFSVYSLRRRGELVVTLIDITEQKKVDTAKSEFVALATHQLRTPITAIRFSAELLAKHITDGGTEKNRNYLDKINRNVGRMLALINDFLDVSKLEMGTFATEQKTINVTSFITDILDEFTDRATKQNIEIVRSSNSPDLEIQTDPRLLNIILSNLVSNAIKYTPANGNIQINFTHSGSAVRFEIIDSGIGIPAADIPQLFVKFYRASNAQAIQTEGTGLGLYVVEQAVKQLDGTIELVSDTGIGTHFTVTLPLD